jgi:hypothetical protein
VKAKTQHVRQDIPFPHGGGKAAAAAVIFGPNKQKGHKCDDVVEGMLNGQSKTRDPAVVIHKTAITVWCGFQLR